ncbi:Odorant receptor 2a [Pseudolycoriella hygida]|uniref:Odorant receptor n=1 Tax=Pseudolycoriella hygida TaxID=35572 RepID=A0A9Q0NFH5_9DIPT|nr:Odorant receptor 2a [Pseudolycoriella hygida]
MQGGTLTSKRLKISDTEMYKVEVHKTLCIITQLMFFVGVWQNEKKLTFCQKRIQYFYMTCPILFMISLGTFVILSSETNEAIFVLQLAIPTAVLNVKLAYLLFKQNEILGFLYDPICEHSIQDRMEWQRVTKIIDTFMKFVRAYVYMIGITSVLVLFLNFPVFSSDRKLPAYISFPHQLPDSTYWFFFVVLDLGVSCCFLASLLVVLVWYAMYNYSIAYQVLGSRLRRLGLPIEEVNERQRKNAKSKLRNSFAQDLIKLVKYYRNLSETVKRFRDFFSLLFFAQIATSGISMCISVYSLAYNSDQNLFQTYVSMVLLFYATLDIFFVMFFASEITSSSDRLSFCLYESNWIGEVLQQPQELKILVYPMNLETFTSIVKGSYSLFNLLQNFK